MIYIALLFILLFVKKSTEFLLVVLGETIAKDHYKNEIQTNLYYEVTFGTKKKWPHKTGDLLKEVQFI